MKLRHIAAAAALATIAGQASALTPAVMNAAATLKVYMSGASALKASIGGLFTQNCQASTLTTYTLTSDTGNYTIYSCTLNTTNDFGLSGNVMFQKRDAGGSGMGVYPVANGTGIAFIDPNTCTGGASGTGTCTGQTTVVPDAGVSDVEPAMFAAPSNTPTDFIGQSIASGTMAVKPIMQTVFGLAVSNALYTKLQADQGLAASVRPSVSKDAIGMMLRSGYNAGTYGWSPLLPNTTDGTQLSQLNICRRVNGSGTQTAANRFWLEYPLNSFVTMEPAASGDSSAAAVGTTAGELFVSEGSGTSNVLTCLTSANTLGAYAIGHVSLENAETAAWKFVKVGGQEPSRDQAKAGKYGFFVESTCQIRNAVTVGTTKRTFLDAFCNGAASPTNLQSLTTAVQNGVMTPPSNPACPGTVAPATTFCSKVTRNGNTAEFPSFY